MSEYKLPSGRASVDMSGTCMEKDFTYSLKRKQLEEALEEALILLWDIRYKVQHNDLQT